MLSKVLGCVQALRNLGSGCATQPDVDWIWQEVQSRIIRDMAFKDNLRIDGRGFIDTRLASFQVTTVCCSCCFVLASGVGEVREWHAVPAGLRARISEWHAVPAVPAMPAAVGLCAVSQRRLPC